MCHCYAVASSSGEHNIDNKRRIINNYWNIKCIFSELYYATVDAEIV